MTTPEPLLRPATVLIVEDEPLVRATSQDMLEDAGFTVVTADNADEALDILQSHRDIDVMMSDINMPGRMDGLSLAHVVRHRWPYVAMLLVSGRVFPAGEAMPRDTDFVMKPFDSDALIRRIGVLARRRMD